MNIIKIILYSIFKGVAIARVRLTLGIVLLTPPSPLLRLLWCLQNFQQNKKNPLMLFKIFLAFAKVIPEFHKLSIIKKNSAVYVRTRTVNVNTFSTTSIICLEIEITMKDEISEGR